MGIISVVIPLEVEGKMSKYSIDWTNEVKEFLLRRMDEFEMRESMGALFKALEKIPQLEPNSS